MKKTIGSTLLLAIIYLFLSSRLVLAYDAPDFPTCSNPQGTQIVSYTDGTHGIVGSTMQYTGSDEVYQLDSNKLLQCFCSEDGTGIQTNWWKTSCLDPDQLQILKNDGWIYVANGALWGLEETAYMAKNTTYSCLGAPTPTPTKTTSTGGGSDGRSDGRSDGLGCGSHDCSGNAVGGAVLGTSTSIFGLAATGGMYLPFVLAAAGALLTAAGIMLRYKTSKK